MLLYLPTETESKSTSKLQQKDPKMPKNTSLSIVPGSNSITWPCLERPINEHHVTNLLHSPRQSATRNCADIGRVRRTADWLKTMQCDWFISIRIWRRIHQSLSYVLKLPKMRIYIGTVQMDHTLIRNETTVKSRIQYARFSPKIEVRQTGCV